VGTVDSAAFARGASYLLVRWSSWRGDQWRVLPASLVSRVDVHDRRLCVDASRDRIRQAPCWIGGRASFEAHRRDVAAYFHGEPLLRLTPPGEPVLRNTPHGATVAVRPGR
jgi:hypothetical protein